ncbi:MAG: helix-turn-helix transcriptional regulator [Clostridia bacterium]|nr:helix-turn-helix transcriptional regulator [Clostridia bacterium]
MSILSKLPERLKEELFEKEFSTAEFAEKIGVKRHTVTQYLQGVRLPKFHTFVAMLDLFHSSADFLLGRSENPDYERAYLPTPPFCERLRVILAECNLSQYALQKRTGLSWNNFHFWLNGKRSPSPELLEKIADALDVSVDYLLGRVK